MKNAFMLAAIALLLSWGAAAAPVATLPQLYKRVAGAVVVVRTVEHLPGEAPRVGEARLPGLGSGMLISADGKVLTAAHVVQLADAVGVEFSDGTFVEAKVVAADPAADLALLQLARVPAGVRPVPLGDSDKAQVGDQIFIVGAPFGISHTLTVGYLSARRDAHATFGSMESAEVLQTDAAINQGNSGGPMFNLAGEVIGIVSRIVSRSGSSDGLGFAVSSNTARRMMIAEPTVWSGVAGYRISPEMAAVFNVPQTREGLLVQRVAHGSPAERLGLRGGQLPAVIAGEELIVGGDIIVAVDGIELGTPNAYETIRKSMIEDRDTMRPIKISVLREGSMVELSGEI